MRNIKFRAWTGQKMVKVKTLEYSVSEGNMIANGWILPKTIMQYTGLKDKNDVEIYEGDIVLYSGTDSCGKKVNPSKLKIEWDEEGAWNIGTTWGYTGEGFFNLYICEVIGNIYENPGLLNAKE